MTDMSASVPEGMVVYAVGDIHGQLDLLDDLLEKIMADARLVAETHRRVLVFVGDYLDRGPDSAGVIERLISNLPTSFEVHCLMGNHEAILLEFLEDPTVLDHWLRNGAQATLASYGIEVPNDDAPTVELIRCRDEFIAALPPTHLQFLKDLPLSVSLGDYHFVHAGVRPGVPLHRQERHDMLWIRDVFLDSDEDLGCVVVHGHTPGLEPVVRNNRIGIDTGAWANGRLTAVRLLKEERSFLAAEENRT